MGPGRGPGCSSASTRARLCAGSYAKPVCWHHCVNHLAGGRHAAACGCVLRCNSARQVSWSAAQGPQATALGTWHGRPNLPCLLQPVCSQPPLPMPVVHDSLGLCNSMLRHHALWHAAAEPRPPFLLRPSTPPPHLPSPRSLVADRIVRIPGRRLARTLLLLCLLHRLRLLLPRQLGKHQVHGGGRTPALRPAAAYGRRAWHEGGVRAAWAWAPHRAGMGTAARQRRRRECGRHGQSMAYPANPWLQPGGRARRTCKRERVGTLLQSKLQMTSTCHNNGTPAAPEGWRRRRRRQLQRTCRAAQCPGFLPAR